MNFSRNMLIMSANTGEWNKDGRREERREEGEEEGGEERREEGRREEGRREDRREERRKEGREDRREEGRRREGRRGGRGEEEERREGESIRSWRSTISSKCTNTLMSEGTGCVCVSRGGRTDATGQKCLIRYNLSSAA